MTTFIILSTVVFSLPPSVVVQLLLAVVLPLLVGLVTKRVTTGGAKATLLALLTLIASLLTELGRALSAGTSYDLGLGLLAAIPAFAISVATHYGLWKPTGASDGVIAVGSSPADDTGVGADPADPAEHPAAVVMPTNITNSGGLPAGDDELDDELDDGEDRDANDDTPHVDPYPDADAQDDGDDEPAAVAR
jgi:hypothetical protein